MWCQRRAGVKRAGKVLTGIRHTEASNVGIMGSFTDATGIGVGTFFVVVTSGLTGSTVGAGGYYNEE